MKKYGLLIVFGQMGLMAFAQTAYQDASHELAARARSQGPMAGCRTCDQSLLPTVRVLSYNVDGHTGYFVSGNVPNSDVELYSTSTGGQVLAHKEADEKGVADFRLPAAQKPAFALNHNRRNGRGASGNAQLYTIGGTDLVLNNFDLNTVGGDIRLSWNAATASPGWTFVLQRSRDNKLFEDVQTMATKEGAGLTGYSTVQAAPKETTLEYYRVEARSSTGFAMATQSELMKFVLPAFFQAQPTVFNNSVQLVVAPDRLPSKYAISDMSGRNKLYSGVLTTVNQTLSLKLPAGTYIVTVTDRKGATASQMIIRN